MKNIKPTLKQIYEIAYPEKPFSGWKNPGHFILSNIMFYALRKELDNNEDIGAIDILINFMYEQGLDIDDLRFCFDEAITKREIESFDVLLYKANSNDKIFDEFRKKLKLLPDYAVKKLGLTKKDYKFGSKTTYFSYNTQDALLMLCDPVFDYSILFDSKYNLKDCQAGSEFKYMVKDFFHRFKNCIDNHQSIKKFAEEYARNYHITLEDIQESRDMLLNNADQEIVDSILAMINPQYENQIENDLFDINKINDLDKMVVGQEKVMQKIKNRLLSANIGFRQENQPIASFLLTGPTGVGKTETAKAIAKACFNDKLYVVDMSTFKNSIDVSRLTGGSPNYVGYGDKNNFCEFVKENPNCVILFDELEKAHPDCTDVVMRILDEGQFINAKGEVYSFENTVIICTTNLTQNKTVRLGFLSNDSDENTAELVTGDTGFKKEIVGRFSDVLEYKMLEKEDCKKIAKTFIEATIKNFEKYNKRNLKIKFDESLLEQITYKANTRLLGARDLKKTIQSEFVNVVSSYIIENDCKNETLTVTKEGIKKFNTIKKITTETKQNENVIDISK